MPLANFATYLPRPSTIRAFDRAPPIELHNGAPGRIRGIAAGSSRPSRPRRTAPRGSRDCPTCDIGRRRGLEVERADPVGTRFQEKVEFVELERVERRPVGAEGPVEDDPPAPGVRRCVADRARHNHRARRGDRFWTQRKLGQEERNSAGPIAIGAAIDELEPVSPGSQVQTNASRGCGTLEVIANAHTLGADPARQQREALAGRLAPRSKAWRIFVEQTNAKHGASVESEP